MSKTQIPTTAPPDPLFVVFFRICGVDEMATDGLGTVQQVLMNICQEVHDKQPSSWAVHSSVYGRFSCVIDVKAAMETAETVLDKAAQQGVKLAVGITEGRVGWVDDLNKKNVIGPPINLAARLAAMKEAESPIVVSDRVCQSVREALGKYKDKFIGPTSEQVKRTEFKYYRLDHNAPNLGEISCDASGDVKTIHALVYDVVQFSEMGREDAWTVLTQLQKKVVDVLNRSGALEHWEKGRIWYAPAGDGGVLVFSSEVGGDTVLDVATKIAEACRDKQKIRLGVATGSVSIIGDELPVGGGILRADQLSSFPDTGHICVDQKFWSDRGTNDKKNWTTSQHAEDSNALLIFPPGVSPTTVSTGVPNSDIFDLCPRCLAHTTSLATDRLLTEFLDATISSYFEDVVSGNFIDVVKKKGALGTLRGISDALSNPSVIRPDSDKMMNLLASVAPFHVSAEAVQKGRDALGIDHVKNRYSGGVFNISVEEEDNQGADAIIRAALFDQPCAWKKISLASDSYPTGDFTMNIVDVPFKTTVAGGKVAELKQRILEECRTKHEGNAIQKIEENLYDGLPLTVLCDADIKTLLGSPDAVLKTRDGQTFEFKELLMFLSMSEKEQSSIVCDLLERLKKIIQKLGDNQRSNS